MILQREGITRLDNDNEYIEYIGSAIKLADPLCYVRLNRTDDKLHVNISPSNPEFKQHIIDTVLDANRRMGLVIHFL